MAKKKSFKPNWLLIAGGAAAAYYVWKNQAAKKINGIGNLYIPNVHLIEVKYLGATDRSGSRVKLFSHRFESGKTLNYNYSHRDITETAIEYLKSKGFNIIGKGEMKNSMFVISDTFQDIK